MVGNGYCNDQTNNDVCDYDGGDCCWDINSDMCTECVCHCQNVHLVANGICNDEANTFECNYDGGDCCVNVDSDHCVNCSCIGGGVISSPGFPQPYSINLHLIWHIQVPLGKYIRIDFIKFDVGETFSQILSGKW